MALLPCSVPFMMNVIFDECHKQALYAECRYAECRSAKPLKKFLNLKDSKSVVIFL
jgi:hypothetical protein